MKNEEYNNNDNLITIIVILLLIIFFMYACYQEQRYNNLENRLEKIEQYTNYLF